jgi:hypothetical protein
MEDWRNSFEILPHFSEPQRLFLMVIKDYQRGYVRKNDPYLWHLSEAMISHNITIDENRHEECAWNCPLDSNTYIEVFVSEDIEDYFIFRKNEKEV